MRLWRRARTGAQLSRSNPPLAAIFGCGGTELSPEERRFFSEVQPLGFILFARNVESPEQIRQLTKELREIVGRADAPILIDQEGGRVRRLKPPYWRAAPPMAVFDKLPGDKALQAAKLNARLIATELCDLGINVDCAPVLDVPIKGAHDIIGDRALSSDPARVALIGRAVCEGLLEGGVLPVIKHIPGHGRAFADSHLELPNVEASLDELRKSDFLPFKELADQALAMTAHVVYTALDPAHPATTSAKIIADFLRGEIGFDGLLMSDDLSMKALSGNMTERTQASLAAGCDIVLHCNGEMGEMREVAQAARPLDADGVRRWNKAASLFRPPRPFDSSTAEIELAGLLS